MATYPKKVEHHYRDLSHVTEENMELLGLGKPEDVAGSESSKNFPVKLHYMLRELERDGLDHVISWQPHGRCFVVHKQKEFVDKILPLWFRQSKFASFQRQLNLYGFMRLTTGNDKGGYYHELFLRGKRFLAAKIQRLKIKGNGARKPSSPETEPNFYVLPSLPRESDKKKEASVKRPPAVQGNLAGFTGLGLPGAGFPLGLVGGASLPLTMSAASLPTPLAGPNLGVLTLDQLIALTRNPLGNQVPMYPQADPMASLLAAQRAQSLQAHLQRAQLLSGAPLAPPDELTLALAREMVSGASPKKKQEK